MREEFNNYWEICRDQERMEAQTKHILFKEQIASKRRTKNTNKKKKRRRNKKC